MKGRAIHVLRDLSPSYCKQHAGCLYSLAPEKLEETQADPLHSILNIKHSCRGQLSTARSKKTLRSQFSTMAVYAHRHTKKLLHK